MKVDQILDLNGLDALIQVDTPFFLYRRPGTTPWVLAVFSPSSVHQLPNLESLNNRQGYVLAPFSPTKTHPIILLTQPCLYKGSEAISSFLHEFQAPSSESASLSNQSANDYTNQETTSTADREAYHQAYEACLDAINKGFCQKVVLSRVEKHPRSPRFSPANLFQKACKAYPEAFVYLCHTSQSGTWLGSSPETLLENHGSKWSTVALAGTRSGNRKGLSGWDTKNLDEQRMVSYHVEDVLDRYGLKSYKEGPVSSRAGELTHLKTTYYFSLPEPLKGSMGDMLASLHPTPATCGWPIPKAQQLLNDCEKHQRAYYAGFVGPLQVAGNTALYVNLRCMHVLKDQLNLYAGGGLLADSNETAEWMETSLKLHTLASLLD